MRISYRYLFAKSTQKDLGVLQPTVRKRIGKKLQYFIQDGDPLKFATKLTNKDDGDYRFRVGEYRVIFTFEDSNIYVLRVQHRREVYRDS